MKLTKKISNQFLALNFYYHFICNGLRKFVKKAAQERGTISFLN